MFESISLSEVIQRSGILGAKPPTSSGWYNVKCAICSDYKTRGAFKFDEDGTVAYHCFNCGHTALFTPSQTTFTKKMNEVLRSFGIDQSQAKRVLFRSFGTKPVPLTAKEKLLVPAQVIELPKTFAKLDPHTDSLAAQYILSRGLALDTTDWYVAPKTDNIWKNRVIIPVKNDHKQLVFYQGRSYINSKRRWESPDLPKTNVLFNHHLLKESADNVIVCEGIFDALSVDGVAILGSSFSDYQLSELVRFRGTKIIVPNKDNNGKSLALDALKHGFSLAFPDIGTCTDLNEAFVKYGKLYVEHQIHATTCRGMGAQMRLGVWCGV